MRKLLVYTCGLTLAVVAFAALGGPAWTDDRDLLRMNTAKPYLFILLDNSSSMHLTPGDDAWLPANADAEASKFFGSQRALYEVFQFEDQLHFGFNTFNQVDVRVVGKHWVYRADADGLSTIGYPSQDEILTFGTHFEVGTTDASGDVRVFETGVAGTCEEPFRLNQERDLIHRFAKLGANGAQTSKIWLRTSGNGDAQYLLEIARPGNKPDGNPNAQLGQNNLVVRFDLYPVNSCTGPDLGSREERAQPNFREPREFLMHDGPPTMTAPGGKGGGTEATRGDWNWQGIRADAAAACPVGQPFDTGGWEPNYDTTTAGADPPACRIAPTGTAGTDEFCAPGDERCGYNLKRETVCHDTWRELDRGDMIPFDWDRDQRDAFLTRLNPNHGVGPAEFRAAPFFQNTPGGNGLHLLKSPAQRPLLAHGFSPLNRAITDFRCWYLGGRGPQGKNRCAGSPYLEDNGGGGGWEIIAAEFDSEWGCRRPYLVIITDGESNCGGQNPSADTAGLLNVSRVRTWVLAYGGKCVGNLNSIAQNGGGECIEVGDEEQLKEELDKIRGIILEEARAFASAAVPSVQATVADKIYLTQFTPLNDRSIWPGSVHSYLKPLPLTDAGTPDLDHENHLWDAGQVLLTQVPPSNPLGPSANQRRVYYARDNADGGTWTAQRRFFDPTNDGTDATNNSIRFDLWRGLGIPFDPNDDDTWTPAEERANEVIDTTLSIKTHTFADTGETIEYLLGDIFHSDPKLLGNPTNSRYFALDLYEDLDEGRGYRAFAREHRNRRKVLLMGSNDGMVHAFEAGIFEGAGADDGHFNDGTGTELFAFIPRRVLPTVRTLAESNNHQWGVDGTITLSDVFIDPVHTGTPEANDREWRTIMVGGLREGGVGYYALDITQPDSYNEVDGILKPTTDLMPSCIDGGGGCGPAPFPSPLWEFDDTVRDLVTGERIPMDENGNGFADLGETWSVPNVGRIRICGGVVCDPAEASNDVEDRFVAVFGGGMDPDKLNQRGNWLYMVDVETGEVIYKRELEGSAPAEPAAVDTNRDGYFDRIYIGTTAGFLYRVDLVAEERGASRELPRLVDLAITDLGSTVHTVERVDPDFWQPKKIFDTRIDPADEASPRRPIYQRTSVIFVPRLNNYALAFGTGDRENLWNFDNQRGRFYVFTDDSHLVSVTALPFTDDNFVPIAVEDDNFADMTFNMLVTGNTGERGWFLDLEENERLITHPFALSGVLFFTSYRPLVETETVGGGQQAETFCTKAGTSRVFVVLATNANALLRDDFGDRTRHMEFGTFVTNPFTELGQTKNPAGEGDGKFSGDLDERMRQLMLEMQQALFPGTCRFANYRIDIKTLSADTGVIHIAPVPICIAEKNWREL